MTSYKLKPELFSLNHQKFPSSHEQSSKKRPSFNIHQQQSPNDHKIMINQIKMKNEALKGHTHQKQSNTTHPNYLTFCQQYTQMLCHKYNPQPLPQPLNHNRNQENHKPKTFNQQLQQKISLNLIAYKRYFQVVQFDFDKNYQQLMMRVKYLMKMLYTRNSAFAEKDQQVDQQLLIMEMFMIKINVRISKESMKFTNYFVTPFSMFLEEVKRGKTPEREKRKKNKRKDSLGYYEQKDFIKGDNEAIREKRQKAQKTRSFIVTPNSPQMLLHSFNQQYNKKKHPKQALCQHQQSNQTFVSFNQLQTTNQNHNHNYSRQASYKTNNNKEKHNQVQLQNLQRMGDTLKYSESQMMGNQLNINLASRSVDLQSSVEETELNGHQLPFSPVQPYRLHRLYNQANLKKLNQGNSHNTHKTDGIQQQLFIQKENQAIFKQAIGEIQTTFHTSINPLKINTQKLSLALNQTLTDVTQIISQSHILLKQQKLSLNQDWDNVLKFISRDIQQLENGLIIDKQQNDMKDKKFLENLEIVQNEIIEQIFEEKQSRKAEENVLTQVLTNLVENLENGFA